MISVRFNIPVVPHSGGIGLNEYTQHLALINYLCISGEKSMLENISSFNHVITHAVQIEDGHFVTPRVAGYSVEYKPDSIAMYEYPDGEFWCSSQGLAIRRDV
jgi:L-galactonate dehydratase